MSIIDPATNMRYSLRHNKGKDLLKSYVKYYQSGGANTDKNANDVVAEKDMLFKTQTAWLKVTSVEFDSIADIKKLQKTFSKNESYQMYDKIWEERLNLIIDFMGNYAVWEFMLNDNVDIYKSKPPRKSTLKKSGRHQAYFTGHHWLSVVKNTNDVFDPYKKYQIFGTNQFCQTYALMNLMNKLPGQLMQICKPYPDNSFRKYYYYTKCALDFIVEVIKTTKKAKLKLYDTGNKAYFIEVLKWANALRRNSNVALNIIGMPIT
jgi:hypothetical protein